MVQNLTTKIQKVVSGDSLMTITVDSVVSEAMQLPEDQRITFAHRLLSSVEPILNPEVEALWDAEIRERICRQRPTDR